MVQHLDKEGYETLSTLAGADNFNKWMYETIRPFVKGRVLETGSGIGNISALLLETQKEVVLSDFSLPYTAVLLAHFKDHPHLSGILQMDLVDSRFDERHSSLFGSFDTIIALNVIEHVEEDGLAVGNCRKLLKQGGRFIILVPAYAGLYNRFDKELGHCRRYTKKTLQQLISPHFSILQCRYFNLAGIAGWFFSGTILRKKIIPSSQMRCFNALVPLFRVLDKMGLRRIGLSVWAVGTNNKSPSGAGTAASDH